jgi:uncharacterized GH25 family protein
MRLSLLALLLVSSARAHDYWLQPETFVTAPNKPVAVRLLVGDNLEVETERAFERKTTLRLQLTSASETRDLLASGKEGGKPFLTLRIKEAGSHWIALERDRRTIRLEAEKFNDYLIEEGLDRVLDQRRLAKESDKPGRERYSRYLKCLLRCGDGDESWKKPLGHRLEIVPLSDPSAVKPGGMLKVRVQFDGKPLPDVAIFALHRKGEKVQRQKEKTDRDGVAAYRLGDAGQWLIRMVHMRRCPDPEDADWESFWTSLSFATR